MNTIEPIFFCKTTMKNIIWDFLKRLHFHFSHNFFLNCKPYYIQYSVCILYVWSIGRKEMLQAHTPLHYDLNICKRHWVTFPNQCVRILYWGAFFCICIIYRTPCNVILRIARNLLKTRENIKIESHPYYHIICD